jgi:hypothetical protein
MQIGAAEQIEPGSKSTFFRLSSSASTDRIGRASGRLYVGLLTLLAVASYLLYAAGALALRQDRATGWGLEAQGAIPAAVSYLVYGTPLGAVDRNVEAKFLHPEGLRAQDTLALAASKSIPPGAFEPTTIDGTGAGTDVFAIFAMAMFGLNLLALILAYLVLIGIAAVAFVLRFRDRRLIAVALYFFVITIMLLTPLGTSPMALDQVPIGGQRYFVLASFLPALHIFFEIVDRSPPGGRKREIANSLLLFIQALLLLGALLVRSSTGYLVLALLAAWAWQLYRDRRQPAQLCMLLRKTAILVGACAISVVVVMTALPAYVQSGRLFGNVWHRAFSTLNVHPDWPFGDLAKVYDCTKYFPQGFNRERVDENGQCVWWAYPANAKRPYADVARDTYGGDYEKVVRHAYFYVLSHYPRQMFETYAFVKSGLIKKVIVSAWNDLFELAGAPVGAGLFVIAVAQFLVFVGFVVAVAITDRAVIDRQVAIFPVFFVLSLAPLYVAFATVPTAVDMVFLMYACLVLAVLWVLQLMRNAIASGAPPRPAQH